MSIFFDIGANIGNWALANINKCDKIISVEASPITFYKLVNNCKNDKIILLNYAVCNNNNNDIIFYHADIDALSTINKDWLTKETSRCYGIHYTELICKTISIDQLIEQYGIPDLIKIDVEGGEYHCISSLTKKVNLICFEWAYETSDITFNCIEYLFNLGYTQYYNQINSDEYLFRPTDNEYYDISTVKTTLLNAKGNDCGMIWCK
jgi:FkbM family methyltransferase